MPPVIGDSAPETGLPPDWLFIALFAKKLAEHLRVLAHRAGAMADVPSVAEVALVWLDVRAAVHATKAVRRRLRLTVRPIPALALALFSSKPSLATHARQSTLS